MPNITVSAPSPTSSDPVTTRSATTDAATAGAGPAFAAPDRTPTGPAGTGVAATAPATAPATAGAAGHGLSPVDRPPLRLAPAVVRPGVPWVVRAGDIPEDVLQDRLRTGSLVRVLRGVYAVPPVPGPSWQVEQHLLLARAAAVHARRRGTCWFSHRTAAILWGCAVSTLPTAVDVTSRSRRRGSGGVRPAFVRDHWTADATDTDVVDGLLPLPVTSLTRTLVDCARTLPGPEALVVADAAVRIGADLDLAGPALASATGHRGVRPARLVLERADARAESAGESLLRWWIAEAGLPAPDLQVPVRTRLG